MNLLISVLATALGFFAGSKVLSGVYLKDFPTGIWVSIVVGLLSYFVGGFLSFVTFGLLGWGIFSFLITLILIKVADSFMDDFEVNGFIQTVFLAAIVAGVQMVVGNFLGTEIDFLF